MCCVIYIFSKHKTTQGKQQTLTTLFQRCVNDVSWVEITVSLQNCVLWGETTLEHILVFSSLYSLKIYVPNFH